jgi:hypothetical protein
VKLDEGLAEGYAGLAEALYVRAASRNGLDDAEHARVKQMAARAATIEPDLAAVEIAAGLAADTYREGLKHLARAVALDPSSAEAYHQVADQLIHVDTPRAVRIYEHARTLDPRMFPNYADLVLARMIAGDHAQASAEVDALLRATPDNPRAGMLKAVTGADQGRGLIAVYKDAAERNLLPPMGFVYLAQRQAVANQPDEALATLDAVLARTTDLCEAHAVRTGLLIDLGKRAELARARQLTITPPRCAALIGAANGSATVAAAALQAVATNESALRSWMQIRFGVTGESGFEQRLYPWNKVAQAPEVTAAHRAIVSAMQRLKQIADEELKALP